MVSFRGSQSLSSSRPDPRRAHQVVCFPSVDGADGNFDGLESPIGIPSKHRLVGGWAWMRFRWRFCHFRRSNKHSCTLVRPCGTRHAPSPRCVAVRETPVGSRYDPRSDSSGLRLPTHHRPPLCFLHLQPIFLARCTSTDPYPISMQSRTRIVCLILAIVAMRLDRRPAMRKSEASPELGGRGGGLRAQ